MKFAFWNDVSMRCRPYKSSSLLYECQEVLPQFQPPPRFGATSNRLSSLTVASDREYGLLGGIDVVDGNEWERCPVVVPVKWTSLR